MAYAIWYFIFLQGSQPRAEKLKSPFSPFRLSFLPFPFNISSERAKQCIRVSARREFMLTACSSLMYAVMIVQAITRSFADAGGPRDAPQRQNITLEKACNGGNDLQGYLRSSQLPQFDRLYSLWLSLPVSRLGRGMVNLHTKSEVCMFTHYEDIEDSAKRRNWRGLEG